MKALSAAELLQAWDEGANKSLLEKTLHLLGKAYIVNDPNEMAKLSIGERDARLLQIREWAFGSQMKNMATCPRCAQVTEWETNTGSLYLQAINPRPGIKTFWLEKDGFKVRFRLPDSHDVASLTATGGNDSQKLLSGCILEIINSEGQASTADNLPQTVWHALDERMEEEDPQADIRMQVSCPYCEHTWEARFDIMSFLWAEINNWAKHIMQEVCLLARAFSWSEKDILAMSAERRRSYIELLYK